MLSASLLPVMDHFDNFANSMSLWENIIGGSVKIGCGSLIPLAHGNHLYFDGCGTRMASTVQMDVSLVRSVKNNKLQLRNTFIQVCSYLSNSNSKNLTPYYL